MNAYLDAYREVVELDRLGYADYKVDNDSGRIVSAMMRREELVLRFAWAVPNPKVIEAIARLSPIVEVGAGSGYWANLIREAGAEIQAFDNRLFWRNHYTKTAYFPIAKGDPVRAMSMYGDRTLLLVWPPYSSDMAAQCIDLHRGERVVYVGEGEGGCTGNDRFHEALSAKYEVEADHDIPSWPGLHDYMTIWRRRGA